MLVLSLSAIITIVILYNTYMRINEEKNDLGEPLGNHTVYNRDHWRARPPRAVVPLAHPTKFVIISHSASVPCNSFQSCSSLVRNFQDWHISLANNDIGYNFVIGGDANIYVGRGWDVRNFHNSISIGINFIGDFNYDLLNASMIDAAKILIEQGLELKKLSQEYILIGHNQSAPEVPISPGVNVYREIMNWPHFSNKTYF